MQSTKGKRGKEKNSFEKLSNPKSVVQYCKRKKRASEQKREETKASEGYQY